RVASLDDMAAILASSDHDLGGRSKALHNIKETKSPASGGAWGIGDKLSEARRLRDQTVNLKANVHSARRIAAAEMDALALAVVAEEHQRMAHALDKTEQQIAHLYEYLALESLGEDAQ